MLIEAKSLVISAANALNSRHDPIKRHMVGMVDIVEQKPPTVATINSNRYPNGVFQLNGTLEFQENTTNNYVLIRQFPRTNNDCANAQQLNIFIGIIAQTDNVEIAQSYGNVRECRCRKAHSSEDNIDEFRHSFDFFNQITVHGIERE